MENKKDIYEEFLCLGKTIRIVMHPDYTYEEYINENGQLTPISFLAWAIQQKQNQTS